MGVAQAQEAISAAEFAEWMAYDSIDPIGQERADLRTGIITATLANANQGRGGHRFKPADFMPKFDQKPRPSDDRIAQDLEHWFRCHNKAIGE